MRKTLFTAMLLLAPRVALACPVCFGQNDSPMAQAINFGILVMIAVVGAVLAAFASFFVYLARRARVDVQAEQSRTGGVISGSADAGQYVPNV